MSTPSLVRSGHLGHTLLGPNCKAILFFGLLLPQHVAKKYLYYIMNLFFIIFVATEIIEMSLVQLDKDLLLNNLKTTLIGTVSVAKLMTFVCCQKKWEAITDYVLKTDLVQRKSSDTKKMNILKKHTKNCHIKTYLYWSLVYTTGLINMLFPVLKYIISSSYRANLRNGTEEYAEIYSSWVPFDKSTLIGYLGVSAFQGWATIYVAGWVMTFDTTSMVVMVFFRCELEMLRVDTAKIFGDESQLVDAAVAFDRLKVCHRRHVEMIKHAKLFDSCLSPVMFFYMIVCSVMLCVTSYQIAGESSFAQKMVTMEYLLFALAQLSIYYWHSNDVLYASQELILGPYECSWYEVDVKRRKDLYVLTEQFKTIVVFTAGPFSNQTLPTFINILKAAYSYYTLLRSTQ